MREGEDDGVDMVGEGGEDTIGLLVGGATAPEDLVASLENTPALAAITRSIIFFRSSAPGVVKRGKEIPWHPSDLFGAGKLCQEETDRQIAGELAM